MSLTRILRSISIGIVLLSILAFAIAAAPAEGGDGRSGIFGNVVGVDGDVLRVRTKEGIVLVQLTADTSFTYRGSSEGEPARPQAGDRVAAVVVAEGDALIAIQILVIPKKGRVVHRTGVITALENGTPSIVTHDGERVPVDFGLNGAVPEPGTVVTIVGRRDVGTGVVRARAVQRVDETLQRLSEHLEQVGNVIADAKQRVHHIGRVQRMLEKVGERQLQIMSEAVQYLPKEAQAGVEKALANLQHANKAVADAFGKALELAGEQDRARQHGGDARIRRFSDETRPSVGDIAGILGITEDDLVERLGRGISMPEIAQAVGLTEERVAEGVVGIVRQRLVRLAEESEIPAAEVELIVASMKKEAVNQLRRAFAKIEVEGDGFPFTPEDLAPILRLEATELYARMKAGETLASVAETQGFDKDRLLEAVMRLARSRAKSLIADGALRPEDAERHLASLRDKMGDEINRRGGRGNEFDEEFPVGPEQIAAKLGMTVAELEAHFKEGGTLKQLVDTRGRNLEAFIDDVVEDARARLDDLVDEDRMDPRRAGRVLAELKEQLRLHAGPNGPRIVARVDAQPVEVREAPFDFRRLAKILEKPADELRRLLSEGRNIEELARARGMSIDDLIAHLATPMRNQIRHMVETGRLNEDQAQKMFERMRQSLAVAVKRFQIRRSDEAQAHRTAQADPSFRPYGDLPFTLRDAAEVLGLSVAEVAKLMARSDQFPHVLEERGFTRQRFIAAILTLVEKRLRKAVVRAETAENRVGHIIDRLRERLMHDLAVEREALPVRLTAVASDRLSTPSRPATPFDITRIAKILSIPPEELERLLSDGYTIGEVVKQRNASLDHVIDALIEPLKAKLAELAKAGSIQPSDARHQIEAGRSAIARRLREFRARSGHEGDVSTTALLGRPEPEVRFDGRQILPTLANVDEVFRLLGIADKAADLRQRGLSLAHLARELDLDPEGMHARLMDVARDRVDSSIAFGSMPPDKAEEILGQFDRAAKAWVVRIFREVAPAAHTAVNVDPESVLPAISSVTDVFMLLGDGDLAAKLLAEGLDPRHVARELGYDADRLRLRLMDAAGERISAAARSNQLEPEQAKRLFALFGELAEKWTREIFASALEPHPTAAIEPRPAVGIDSKPAIAHVDPATVLPALDSVGRVFQVLGFGDLAYERLSRGHDGATIARELGFSADDHVYLALIKMAENRLSDALASNSISRATAEELMARFKRTADEWAQEIFPPVAQAEPVAGVVGPDFSLPSLDSAADVFKMLGVGSLASELIADGHRLATVAREAGFADRKVMYLTLVDSAKALIGEAVRSRTLSAAHAAKLSTDFEYRAEDWVGVIFADIANTSPKEASLTGDIADGTSKAAEAGATTRPTG